MASPRETIGDGFAPDFRSVTVQLVIINTVIFLGELWVRKYTHWPFTTWLALSIPGLKSGYFWQLITYQFLHGGWMHLLLNCWALYVFGQELEERLGRGRFLRLYLFSGVVGGLIQLLCAWLAPKFFGAAVVGASAGVFGLIAAYAALFPERQLTLLIFFVLPINLRAKTLLFWGVIVALIGGLFPMDNVAHAAHLGGMLGGLVYLNLMHPNRTGS